MVISKKYALSLIRAGKAAREYKPLARCTEARKLDGIYAVLRRVDARGNVRFDHCTA